MSCPAFSPRVRPAHSRRDAIGATSFCPVPLRASSAFQNGVRRGAILGSLPLGRLSRAMRLAVLVTGAIVWFAASARIQAADDGPGTAPAASEAKASQDPVAEWQALQQRRAAFEKDINQLVAKFRTAKTDAEKLDVQREYVRRLRDFQTQVLPRMLELAGPVLQRQPDNLDAAELVMLQEYGKNHFARVVQIGESMLKAGHKSSVVLNVTGVAHFALHDFARAKELLTRAEQEGILDTRQFGADRFLAVCDEYQKLWEREQQIRAAEEQAASDPATALPRVELKTTRGTIVLELFENEAPNTVANFITLVEQGVYDGTAFHRVIPAFMIQGGDPNSKDDDPSNDGIGGPGYTIRCECYRPDARKHFRGSLSMAHAGRDTGGSQFFITHLPTPHLNASAERGTGHTVFGRVVQGMDVVDAIEKGDKIIEATVLRKRPHRYQPQVTKETAPKDAP